MRPRPDATLRDRFVAYLRGNARGRDSALTARRLCPVFGLPVTESGMRVFRALVHEAIESGELICTGNTGYYVPSSLDEIRETVGRLRSEAHELLERASATERLARECFRRPMQPSEQSALPFAESA